MNQTRISQPVMLHGLVRRWELEIPPDKPLIDELARVKIVEASPGAYRLDHLPGQHDDRAIAVSMATTRLLERSVAGPRIRDLSAPWTPTKPGAPTWRRQWSDESDANALAAQTAP